MKSLESLKHEIKFAPIGTRFEIEVVDEGVANEAADLKHIAATIDKRNVPTFDVESAHPKKKSTKRGSYAKKGGPR